MRFDIAGSFRGARDYAELINSHAGPASYRSRAKLRKFGPKPAKLPEFTEDTFPDFQVAVVVSPVRGRRWTAELVWYVGNKTGRFPVIPAEIVAPEQARKPDHKPYQFLDDRAAMAEGARQSQALVDEFITWATNGVEDV